MDIFGGTTIWQKLQRFNGYGGIRSGLVGNQYIHRYAAAFCSYIQTLITPNTAGKNPSRIEPDRHIFTFRLRRYGVALRIVLAEGIALHKVPEAGGD